MLNVCYILAFLSADIATGPGETRQRDDGPSGGVSGRAIQSGLVVTVGWQGVLRDIQPFQFFRFRGPDAHGELEQ